MVQEAAPEEDRGIFPSYSSKELLAMLTEHTSNYTDDGSMLPVRFITSGTSHITKDGVIKVNPVNAWETKEAQDLTEKQAVRVLLNVLSHEVGHYNHSELDSKKKFVENYPTHGKIAGAVVNILEDVYIDRNRTEEFKGLRRPHKWTRQNRDGYDPANATGLTDTAISLMAAISDTPDFSNPYEVDGTFLEDWTRKVSMELAKVPDTHSQEDRLTIAHRLTATLLQKVNDPETKEDSNLNDLLDDAMVNIADRLKDRATEHDIEMEQENISDHADEEVDEQEVEEDIEIDDIEPEDDDFEEEDVEIDDDEDDVEEEVDEVTDGHLCADGTKCQIADDIEDCHVHSKDEDEEPEDEGIKQRSSDDEPEGDGSGKEEGDGKINIDRWEETNPGGSGKVGVGGASDEIVQGLTEAQEDGVELSDDIIEVLEELEEEEEKTRTVNRAKGKKVDVNKVVRRKAGDKSETKIFEKEVDEEQDTEDTAVGVTLDASGSMDGGGLKQGLTAIGALGKATGELEQDFTANTFWSVDSDELDEPHETETTQITEIGDEFSMDDLDDIMCHYRDPLALGVENIAEQLEQSESDNKLLFVVTDGDPTILKDGTGIDSGTSQEIKDECREEVEKQRDKGMDVIGVAVGVSPSEDTMSDIFGADSWFRFEQENLAEKLLTVYRNTVDT